MVQVKLVSVFRIVTLAEMGRPLESVVVPRRTPVVACAWAWSLEEVSPGAASSSANNNAWDETTRRFIEESPE